MHEKNVVQEKKCIIDSRSMKKRSDIVVLCHRPKGFHTHSEAVLAPEKRRLGDKLHISLIQSKTKIQSNTKTNNYIKKKHLRPLHTCTL